MKKFSTSIVLFLFAIVLCVQQTQAQSVSDNPLSMVADYNLNADGSFASGDKMQAHGAYFKWEALEKLQCPNGYHLPTKEELMVIAGRYNMDERPQPPYPDLTWKINKGAEEEVSLFGKTYKLYSCYYGEGKDVCYALRFIGGNNRYLSAYKWETVMKGGTDADGYRYILGIKVTCRLLGPDGANVLVSEIARPEYWANNNDKDVVKFFPASGYGNYTEDGEQMDVHVRGRYWSCTEKPKEGNQSQGGAWGFGFDENMVIIYNWIRSSHFSVRCFKDAEKEPETPVPGDAAVAMQLPKSGISLQFGISGPNTIEVDFGDGKRQKIDLNETEGIVKGVSKGTNINIFGQGITSFRASGNQISSISFPKHMDKLKVLELGFNKLTQLSLTGMSNLEHLNAVSNRIKTLDLTPCPQLTYLSLSKNFNIETLALEKTPLLQALYIGNNSFTKIDLKAVPKLKVLDVSQNSSLNSIDLSGLLQLEEFYAIKSQFEKLDITANRKLQRINVSGSPFLEEIKYSDLSALQSCFVHACALPRAALTQLFKDLPNVANLKVWPKERGWKKQLEIDKNPETNGIDVQEAKAKGWLIDVIEEAWSTGPANPSMVLTTALTKGEKISWMVTNIYDPFWVDWGGRWLSLLQSQPFKIERELISQTIKFYSRGLMSMTCNGMKLTQVDFTNNDQVYEINLADNQLTQIKLDPKNVVMSLDLRNNQLSGEELNNIFRQLRPVWEIKNPFEQPNKPGFPPMDKYGTISIYGNPGMNECDPKIAIKKGFSVSKEPNRVLPPPLEEVSQTELLLAPNPASDYTDVHGATVGAPIRLYSASGVLLKEYKVENISVQRLELPTLPAGYYFVQSGRSTAKLIIR